MAKITAIGAKPIEKMKRHKMEIEVEFDTAITQDEAHLIVTSVLAKTAFYKEKSEDVQNE